MTLVGKRMYTRYRLLTVFLALPALSANSKPASHAKEVHTMPRFLVQTDWLNYTFSKDPKTEKVLHLTVAMVVPNSPFEKADIRKGDRIVSFQGHSIVGLTQEEVLTLTERIRVSTELQVEILDGRGQKRAIVVRLPQSPTKE